MEAFFLVYVNTVCYSYHPVPIIKFFKQITCCKSETIIRNGKQIKIF